MLTCTNVHSDKLVPLLSVYEIRAKAGVWPKDLQVVNREVGQ